MLDCILQIRQNYSALSYSEKLLADYTIKHQAELIHMSIAELSETLGIAAATIISGCKKLGYSGFKEFKLALASAPNNSLLFHWQSKQASGSSSQLYQQVVQSNIAIMNASFDHLEPQKLDDAAQLLIHADTVFLMGESTSAILAQEAYDYLVRLGLRCCYTLESNQRVLQANTATEHDVAVLISQSGLNSSILKVASAFRDRGCPVIGISNFSGTALSNLSDIFLSPLAAPTEIHENNFTLRIPILCILETLFYVIRAADPQRSKSSLHYNMNQVHMDVFGKKL